MTIRRVTTASLGLAGLVAIAAGCASTHNLSSLRHYGEPLVAVESDSDFDFSKCQRFALLPFSEIDDSANRLSRIREKQLLFALRNYFESLGYEYTESLSEADLLATIDGDSTFHQEYIPPETISVPRYVPGQTISTYGQVSGSVHSYAGEFADFYGSYTGTSYVPGYMKWETITRPGYVVGAHYPSISVITVDPASKEIVWSGRGVGVTDNADIRVSGQYVLRQIMSQFPAALRNHLVQSEGVVGIGIGIYTIDGNNYYPVVFSLEGDLPARRAGLRRFDIITSIDGQPTRNQTLSEVMHMMSGQAGHPVSLGIRRLEQEFDVTILRAPR